MAELVRTNDPGVISAIEGLLGAADIPYQVADRNMSVLEGSIIAIQMRIVYGTLSTDWAPVTLLGARMQNSLPSGSASTTQRCFP